MSLILPSEVAETAITTRVTSTLCWDSLTGQKQGTGGLPGPWHDRQNHRALGLRYYPLPSYI